MTKFVGAEYVIASMLIAKSKKGINCVDFIELSQFGIDVQRLSMEKDIDAVFLTSKDQFFNAIYDFSDYFNCIFDSFGNFVKVELQSSKNITDLEYRFMGYLPSEIFDMLCDVSNMYVA